MGKRLEVGVLNFSILQKYVLVKSEPLKILKPRLEQVIYYGWGEISRGIGINHARMIELLSEPLEANEVGFAAVLMDRSRPPSGITVQSAGETLMTQGYVIDRTSVLWVMSVLNEMMQHNLRGQATLEQ